MNVFIDNFRSILLKCEFYANFGHQMKHENMMQYYHGHESMKTMMTMTMIMQYFILESSMAGNYDDNNGKVEFC